MVGAVRSCAERRACDLVRLRRAGCSGAWLIDDRSGQLPANWQTPPSASGWLGGSTQAGDCGLVRGGLSGGRARPVAACSIRMAAGGDLLGVRPDPVAMGPGSTAATPHPRRAGLDNPTARQRVQSEQARHWLHAAAASLTTLADNTTATFKFISALSLSCAAFWSEAHQGERRLTSSASLISDAA